MDEVKPKRRRGRGAYGLRDGSMSSRALAFIKAAPGPVTTAEVREALGLPNSKGVASRLSKMWDAGLIERWDRGQGRGFYAFWIDPAKTQGAKNGN